MQSDSASGMNPFVLKGKAELDPDLLRAARAGWTLKGMLRGQRRIKQFLQAKIASVVPGFPSQLTGEKTRCSVLAKYLNPTAFNNLGQNISKRFHLYQCVLSQN